MKRYDTKLDGDVFYVEGPAGWLEIGELSDLYSLLGGESYTITYDEKQRARAWLDTSDGTLTFDVRDALLGMTFDEEFVSHLEATEFEDGTEDGHAARTEFFADMMAQIWDSKGMLTAEP